MQPGKENDISLSDLATTLGTIPFIGPILRDTLNYLGELVMATNRLSNGLLARVVGGSLPCIIDLDKGIQCSGTSTDGGVYAVIEDMINGLPSTILPDFAKKMTLGIIKSTLNPLLDVLFGGLPKEGQ